MRCNWLRWLWGLLPLGLLIAFTYASTHEAIQTDLQQRSETALRAAGLPWADTTFEGRDARVLGEAFAESDQQRAVDVLTRVWGVRVADDRSALIERADLYLWNAEQRQDRIRLTGFVPNEDVRSEVLAAVQAAFPNRSVIDEMKPARGAPEMPVWLGGIRFGLSQLARLEPGAQVTMRNAEFEIEGQAASARDYRNVRGALAQSLPDGVTLAQNRVTPAVVSPFTWSATYDGSRLTLDGHVPDETARGALLRAGEAAFPGAAIIDRMAVAGGAPVGFSAAAILLLKSAAPLETATLSATDSRLSMVGLAAREETAAAVGESVEAGIPAGFELTRDIKFVEARRQTVSPYRTSVVVSERIVRVDGYVPSPEQRTTLLQSVAEAYPDKQVIDALEIAAGQPEGWSVCLTSGLGALRRVGNGTLSLIDDSVSLTGVTVDESLARTLPGELRTATSRSCRISVDLEVDLPPEPEITWSATREGDRLVLTGETPDSDTRTSLLARAQSLFSGVTVEDEMRVSPAPSTRWSSVAETGLQLLSRLRQGSAVLEGRQLTVTGEARDTAAATAIRQRLTSGLPTGFTGRDVIGVRSDAMIWAEEEARRRAQEEARRREEAAAREREAEAEAARQRAEDARLAAERAEAERRAAEARAAAERAEQQRREAEERARRVEAARREEAAFIAARDRCQEALDQASTAGKINFDTGSSEIASASFELLDRLATAARTCDNVAIHIEGHTDSQGSDEDNQTLSQERAQAIVDYLVRGGVEPDRLTARGYGESRPLVPNTNAANRAQNRRIEFVVRRRQG